MAEVKSNLNLQDENVIRRYVHRVIDMILIYCNREDLPDRLENTAAEMCEDLLAADGIVESKKDIASIKRGDTQINYSTNGSSQVTAGFMKSYENRLVRYKKIKYPRFDYD